MSEDQLNKLKALADSKGIPYHPSIGLEKLKEKLSPFLSDEGGDDNDGADEASDIKPTNPTPTPAPAAAPVVETEGQKRKRLKNEAMALVRIRLTNMNPAKKDWDGEIITVGNSAVGTVSKYVPFNAEEGWHVPKIMYDMLVARQCQVFVPKKMKNGVTIREGKLIREFAIEVLPPLTEEELHDLAQRQAMAQSVG